MAGRVAADAPSGDSTSADLQALAAALVDDRDWIGSTTAEVNDAIRSELPELGTSDEMGQALYASTEANVRLFLEIVRTDADPSDAAPPPGAIELAREFVRHGVSIEALMRTYHLGQARFLGLWSGAVREFLPEGPPRTDALDQGARLSFAYINAVTRGLVKRYEQERDRWVRSAAAVRADVVRALLSDEPVDSEEASRQLGYALERNHLAFVVWRSASADDGESGDLGALERTAAEFAARLAKASPMLLPMGAHLVAGWIGGYETIDVGDPGRLRLSRDAAGGARCAIGAPGSGPGGFARSHCEARHARQVAELSGSAAGSVTSYPGVALNALASADLEHAREFVARELGPLAADEDSALRLAGTLKVYLEESSSPRRTAERLGVHANTIANRVRAIEEQLGHPVQSRIAELLVALRLAPLVREVSE